MLPMSVHLVFFNVNNFVALDLKVTCGIHISAVICSVHLQHSPSGSLRYMVSVCSECTFFLLAG